MLSRLPLETKHEDEEQYGTYLGFVVEDIKLIQGLDVKTEIQNDTVLKQEYDWVMQSSWQEDIKEAREELKPYYYRRN